MNTLKWIVALTGQISALLLAGYIGLTPGTASWGWLAVVIAVIFSAETIIASINGKYVSAESVGALSGGHRSAIFTEPRSDDRTHAENINQAIRTMRKFGFRMVYELPITEDAQVARHCELLAGEFLGERGMTFELSKLATTIQNNLKEPSL